jgi:hypothetical protein
MIKFPASAVTLALLGLVFSVPAYPQPLSLEGILRSEHQQQTLELRRQQDEYRGRKGVQNLSPAKRWRLEDLLFEQQLRQEQLHQRQLKEQSVLHQRLQLQPNINPRPAQYLQMQRFRQEQASQELHFKLQRDPPWGSRYAPKLGQPLDGETSTLLMSRRIPDIIQNTTRSTSSKLPPSLDDAPSVTECLFVYMDVIEHKTQG